MEGAATSEDGEPERPIQTSAAATASKRAKPNKETLRAAAAQPIFVFAIFGRGEGGYEPLGDG